MRSAHPAGLLVVLAVLAIPRSGRGAEDEPAAPAVFAVESNLRAGVAKVDITPAEVDGLQTVGHVRKVHGVHDPICAAVLLLDNGDTKAAIVTLDALSAWDEMVAVVRQRISERTGTPAGHILVAVSHNHSGPGWKEHPQWRERAVERITDAAVRAADELRPVTIGYAEDRIDFGINRRGIVNGKALVRLDPEGPNDPRVKVLRFDDGRSWSPYAVVMHAVCHPCVFTWGDKATPPWPNGFPQMSADFPGIAQGLVEQIYGRTTAMFLQGCAGDIRPNLPGYPYRCGDEADIQWTGRSLGCAAIRAADRSAVREERTQRPAHYFIRCASRTIELPGKQGPVSAELSAMKVGPYLLLTMPGEPMVEYGLNLEQTIADRAIPVVLGYTNGHVGYICTAKAHEYGGYEPNSSPLAPEAEAVILAELNNLADQVIGDVFEVFAPPEVLKQRSAAQEAR